MRETAAAGQTCERKDRSNAGLRYAAPTQASELLSLRDME
jgi:hypothetical protein